MEFFICGIVSRFDCMVETYYAFDKQEAIRYTYDRQTEGQVMQAFGQGFHKSKELNYLWNPRHN